MESVIETTSSPDDVELLNSLGLTMNAARIFIALCNLGTSKAISISKTSGVAREVVYQIMPSLVKKGLVEEVLASPKLFKAIPLKEAYNLLLQRKKEESQEISRKIDEVLKKKANTGQIEGVQHDQTNIIHSGGHKQHFRIHDEYEKVHETIDMTFPLGKFLQWIQYYAELRIEKLKKRNVKMRIITEKRVSRILEDTPEFLTPSINSSLEYINFRYIQNPPPVEMMIFDKKTLFLSTRKESSINRMQWLYSNNLFLLEMANSYYETLWENVAELDA
jgi:sugar-specific transcriptional regulator TrmB